MSLTLADKTARYGNPKPCRHKALRQSSLQGRIPKGLWVSQDIAGGELFDYRQKIDSKYV